MNTTLFYYTGTGNSLWVARTLAKALGETEVVSISGWMKEKQPITSKVIGVVFPVHMWGVPAPIIRFIRELKALSPDYLFAVAVDAGQVANTLVQFKGLCKQNGLKLSAGYEVQLPSNYLPWGGAESKELQEKIITAAGQKIAAMLPEIQKREEQPVEKGPFWQGIVFNFLYKISFNQVHTLDGSFWVDEKCNSCGICRQVCPAENIILTEGKPVWQHHCEQCLACIQWCPQKAIQYGKKTPGYERYHHPEVALKDMVQREALKD